MIQPNNRSTGSYYAVLIFMLCMLCVGVTVCLDADAEGIWTKIQFFADNGFEPAIPGYSLKDGGRVSAETLKERFGQPSRITSNKETDGRETGLIYDTFTWEYKGLIITIVKPEDNKKLSYWIKEIILTNPDYFLKYGLKTGHTKAVFLRELGKPSEEKVDCLIYYVKNVVPVGKNLSLSRFIEVKVELDKNDIVRKITWKVTPD